MSLSYRGRYTQMHGDYEQNTGLVSIAAGTTGSQVVWVNETGASVTVDSAYLTPSAAMSGTAHDNSSYQLINKGTAGSGTKIISTALVTTLRTFTAFVPKAFTLAATATSVTVAAGEVVALVKTETNTTGKLLPQGSLSLQFRFA